MNEDIIDWQSKLTFNERYFLTHLFRFFTQADIDVAGGYVNSYLPMFPQPEVRMMLSSFAAREALHIAAYSHLIETLGLPETIYNQFLEYAAMKDKHEYFQTIAENGAELSPEAGIAEKIAAFSAFTEGLALFSSFIMLLNFPRHGKMKGMGQIVTWSIVDETLHTESMIKLFRVYVEENRGIWKDDLKAQIYKIATKMVELENTFIDLAFSMGPMENLTADDVKQYIKYICDRRLISLGLKSIWNVRRNPLPWIEEMINAPGHTNFFENHATEYSKGALKGSWSTVWAAPLNMSGETSCIVTSELTTH
jgi:ribonucleoside-diphosphate reductase beta chain